MSLFDYEGELIEFLTSNSLNDALTFLKKVISDQPELKNNPVLWKIIANKLQSTGHPVLATHAQTMYNRVFKQVQPQIPSKNQLIYPMHNSKILGFSIRFYRQKFIYYLIPFLIIGLLVFLTDFLLFQFLSQFFSYNLTVLGGFFFIFYNNYGSLVGLYSSSDSLLFHTLRQILYAPLWTIGLLFAIGITKYKANYDKKSYSDIWKEISPKLFHFILVSIVIELFLQTFSWLLDFVVCILVWIFLYCENNTESVALIVIAVHVHQYLSNL